MADLPLTFPNDLNDFDDEGHFTDDGIEPGSLIGLNFERAKKAGIYQSNYIMSAMISSYLAQKAFIGTDGEAAESPYNLVDFIPEIHQQRDGRVSFCFTIVPEIDGVCKQNGNKHLISLESLAYDCDQNIAGINYSTDVAPIETYRLQKKHAENCLQIIFEDIFEELIPEYIELDIFDDPEEGKIFSIHAASRDEMFRFVEALAAFSEQEDLMLAAEQIDPTQLSGEATPKQREKLLSRAWRKIQREYNPAFERDENNNPVWSEDLFSKLPRTPGFELMQERTVALCAYFSSSSFSVADVIAALKWEGIPVLQGDTVAPVFPGLQ